ncbi:MAG: elongation factor G [Lachnospiraceae bacterium]|nr:elongation factor G [Lachnospiraceae bacterium]
MNTYKSEDIRNVAILGHGGSGKTTLIEAIAYSKGIISRMGRVEDGTTISDYDKEEQKRSFSISTSLIPIEHDGVKINFLDAPGYFDFVGEAEEALDGAGAAVIVVNAKAGVEVGTIKAWELCEKKHLPRLFFVSAMDDPNASFVRVVAQLKEHFGPKVAPFHTPIRDGEKFIGFVNIVKMGARTFTKDGYKDSGEIPATVKDDADACRKALLEAVAETSEELMDKYFNEEEFTQEEIDNALHESIFDGSTVPVLLGSSPNHAGMIMLLNAIKDMLPAPLAYKVHGKNAKDGSDFEADYDINKPFSAKVFKTIVDPFIGKYSMIKVMSGKLTCDEPIYNFDKDTEEKISRLYILRGKEAIEVKELNPGDIGAIAKLSNTQTGDTLSTKACPIVFDRYAYSIPYDYKKVDTKNKGEEDKFAQAMAKLCEEDKTLRLVLDKENRQTLLYGIGGQQLDIVVSKLASRYKVEVELSKPRVPYRETIRKVVEKQGKHKKQSGGHGQYGDVHIRFQPSGDMEKPYIFDEEVVGGAVPKNFFPAVEKGIAESVLKGPLAGYPVVGLRTTLFFGSYHPVDSSEQAFKMAAKLAFKAAFNDPKDNASPCLLEPIVAMKILVPDKFTGDIMGDLNKRRGRVLGMNPIAGGKQEIMADVPLAELYGYSTDLRSMTGGIGDFSYTIDRYEQAPSDVQAKVVEEAAKSMTEDDDE